MDKYEVLEHVGKGSFGAVTKIRRKSDNKILVWKEITYGKMKEKEKQQLVSEVNILRELRHPHIVKYYDRIIDKTNSKIYIVMEYCERGDMGQLIKKCKRENDFLSEDVIWKIFMQVLLALQACHNRDSGKILHRDIKPGNVLLDGNMNVKLGDFGLSRILSENSIYAETRVGTPYYMSPEQIADSRYNEKSDIWSAGCLLFEMASLNPPFQAKSHAELAHKINLGQVDRIPLKYSEELQRVINWMLAIDYNQRPKVNEILDLPQVSLRVREKNVRDETQKLKDLEIKIKEREEKAKFEQQELVKKEEEINKREKIAKDFSYHKEKHFAVEQENFGNRDRVEDYRFWNQEKIREKIYEAKNFKIETPEAKNLKTETSEAKIFKMEMPEPKNFKMEMPEPKNFKTEMPEPKNFKTEMPEPKSQAEEKVNYKTKSFDYNTPNHKNEKLTETPEKYFNGQNKYENNTLKAEKKKETSFEIIRQDAQRNYKREKTLEIYGYDRNKSLEREYSKELSMKREKSFENLVQEGLDRAKRDNDMLKVIERTKKDSYYDKPALRSSPNRIIHNNSVPDIPKSTLIQETLDRARKSNDIVKTIEKVKKEPYYNSPIIRSSPSRIIHNNSAPDIPKPTTYSKIINRESPSGLKPAFKSPSYKQGPDRNKKTYLEYCKPNRTGPDYNLFKQIEDRYKSPVGIKNRTSPRNSFNRIKK